MLKTRSIALLGVVALAGILSVMACSSPTATPTQRPTMTPTATPVPAVTRADARDLAILNRIALYPGITTAPWVEKVISLPAVGVGEVEYTYNGWIVTVKYPVVQSPEYDVTIRHADLEIEWTGKVKQDGTVEGPEIDNFFGLAPIMIVSMTPSAMDGKIVTLVGQYRGLRPAGGLPTAESESDWVLNDGTGELYVTGASPASGLDEIGEWLTVTGIVKVGDGIAYLLAVDVQKGFYEGPMAGPR